jgi:uracil phosphoribosyltransferase
VVGSLDGLQKMTDTHPDVKITVGVIDEELNEHGEVLPGLGDTGNRLFHTPHIDDDEYLLHPSKRKRSDA